MTIPINNIPFCRNFLDRQGILRRDNLEIEKLFNAKDTKIILFYGNKTLLENDNSTPLIFTAAQFLSLGLETKNRIFLGIDNSKIPYFAVQIATPNHFEDGDELFIDNCTFADIRQNMNTIDAETLSICGTARSLFAWHDARPYCSRCGHESEPTEAGWKRQCPHCHTEHFPRTDPVAIMLVTYGDKCLLGRSVNFPEGLYSNLAGFIEPGETIEQGCAREIMEEVGLELDGIKIIGNQPWPNPSQLMVAMIATAKDDKLTLDPNEVLSAFWFTKDQVRQLLFGNLEIDGQKCFGPSKSAIARFMLEYWLENEQILL